MNRYGYIPLIGFIALILGSIISVGEDNYVGSNECKTCHSDIYIAWETDAHSAIFEMLEEGDSEENPNCLPCHTTGFYLADDGTYTYKEKNATCENCHGPGNAHIKTGSINSINRGDRAEVCSKCHESYWSPAFNFEKNLGKGIH